MGELAVPERLKQVARWHFRGLSQRKIAEKVGISRETVASDISTITSRIRDFDDIDAYLRATIDRISEQITQIDELMADQWELLDWCKEMVVQCGGPFMAPIAVIDPLTGEPLKRDGRTVWEMGPRKPAGVDAVTARISALLKQRAELLKIVGPKVDVSIQLNMAIRSQTLIMERLRTAAPEAYAVLWNELQVLEENPETGEQIALNPASRVIDAEYTEIETVNDGEVD